MKIPPYIKIGSYVFFTGKMPKVGRVRGGGGWGYSFTPLWWRVFYVNDGTFRLRHIYDVQLSKASRGWNCEMALRIQTRRQCTMEDHTIRGYGPSGHRGLYGALAALWRTYRAVKAEHARLQSEPGEWTLAGHPARQG